MISIPLAIKASTNLQEDQAVDIAQLEPFMMRGKPRRCVYTPNKCVSTVEAAPPTLCSMASRAFFT